MKVPQCEMYPCLHVNASKVLAMPEMVEWRKLNTTGSGWWDLYLYYGGAGEGSHNPFAFRKGRWADQGCLPPKIWKWIIKVAKANNFDDGVIWLADT